MKTVVIVFAVATLASGSHFVCDSTKQYQENKCNYCSCFVKNGQLLFGCTKMACLDPEYQSLRNCDPRTYVPSDNCWCVPDKGVMCEVQV